MSYYAQKLNIGTLVKASDGSFVVGVIIKKNDKDVLIHWSDIEECWYNQLNCPILFEPND